MRRPIKLLLGAATGLGLAAVAWLGSRRPGGGADRPQATKAAAPKRTRTPAAGRSRAGRSAAKAASARKAPVARRSRPRA
jgi:hypothetical protein